MKLYNCLCQNFYLPIILPVVLFLIYISSVDKLYSVIMHADDFHYWSNAAFLQDMIGQLW